MAVVGSAVHLSQQLTGCHLSHVRPSQREPTSSLYCSPSLSDSSQLSNRTFGYLPNPLKSSPWGAPGRKPPQKKRLVFRNAVQTDATPLEKTWSNPTGSVLTEVVPGKLFYDTQISLPTLPANRVWAAERPFIWTAIDVGGKMGVVRLKDGSIWVHSPVPLDEKLRKAIDKLGPVKHIVTPNYEHAGFVQQWVEAYPNAKAYACPGLRAKKPEIIFSGEIGQAGSSAPPEWGGEFSFAFFDCEHNPFTRKAFFNEVVFMHQPSGVLFVTDLFWNYPEQEVPPGTFLWKQGMDRVYLPFYKAFMLKRKDKFESLLKTVTSWGFNVILPCHGYVVKQNAVDVLRKHFQ